MIALVMIASIVLVTWCIAPVLTGTTTAFPTKLQQYSSSPFVDQAKLRGGPSGQYWQRVADTLGDPALTFSELLNKAHIERPGFLAKFAAMVLAQVENDLYDNAG